jgi:hypothetical protein
MATGGASAGSARDTALVRPDPPRRAQHARVFFSSSENRAPWAKSPQAESKPDKEKPRKTGLDSLGLIWIPSSDSGLFNGLRAIQAKKTSYGSGGTTGSAVWVRARGGGGAVGAFLFCVAQGRRERRSRQ